MARKPPIPLAPLVGRQREITELRALLDHPRLRLITLTGPGGVGKTRLAMALIHDLGRRLPADCVALVSLASVRQPGLVPVTIAQALRLLPMGQDDPLHEVGRFVGSKHFLLVFDNFEHLLDAAWIVADLLNGCPNLKVLATSREALRLYGEQVYPVGPLAVPDPADSSRLPELAQVDAVRLFTLRAQAADPRFALTTENGATIATICNRLDGLPLAIELAAARVAVFPPSALLAALNRRLSVLTGGPRNLPMRLRTMRAAIGWSYDSLTADEQEVFRSLSVFHGTITLSAAEAMADRQPHVPDLIASLASKHLLQTRSSTDATARFTMLETVREFALEDLDRRGETAGARERHARWSLAEAERIDAGLQGDDQARCLKVFERSIDDFRAALDWATTHDPHLGLQLARMVGRSYRLLGHFREGQGWLERTLDAVPDGDPRTRAGALAMLGVLLLKTGEVASARGRLEEGLALAEALQDPFTIAELQFVLAEVAYHQGQFEGACSAFEECLGTFRAYGDENRVGMVLLWLGHVMVATGELARARAWFEESLSLYTRIGYIQRIARAHLSLAGVDELEGDVTMAVARGHKALELFQTVNYAGGTAEAELWLGHLALRNGDPSTAIPYVSTAMHRWRNTGAWPGIADALGLCVSIAVRMARPDVAVRLERAMNQMRLPAWSLLGTLERDTQQRQLRQACRVLGPARVATIEAGARLADEQAVVEDALAFLDGALSEPVSNTSSAAPSGSRAVLSRRELTVLRLLVRGMTDRQIADELFISRKTASDHVSHILAKLGAVNRTEAVAVAVRDGLLETPS